MKYAYDYQNSGTRGWTRGDFESFSLNPSSIDEAANALEAVAKSWTNDTHLRLIEIAEDGKETIQQNAAKGSRGTFPKDKKDV